MWFSSLWTKITTDPSGKIHYSVQKNFLQVALKSKYKETKVKLAGN